jgi:hypothetical protein
MIETSTRTRRNQPQHHNDDDWTAQYPHKVNLQSRCQWEDKHRGLTVTKNSTHDDDGTTQNPLPCGGSWLLALNDNASTDFNTLHAYAVLQPPNMCSTLLAWKSLLYSAEQLLTVWNAGAIKGVTGGYVQVGARWCGVHCITGENYSWTLRVWWSRMRAVYAGDHESSTNSTSGCIHILFGDAMKRNFQGWLGLPSSLVIPRYDTKVAR